MYLITLEGFETMKRKIIIDVMLSMIASFIPMLLLQLILLPMIATKINSESYGQLIAIVAFINLISGSLGNVLNNGRLIHYKTYEEKRINGDFNRILIIFIVVNIILILPGLLYYGESLNFRTIIILLISSILLLFNSYASVDFRIKLNYFRILLSAVSLFFGYLIGYYLFSITGSWSLIYICGFGMNAIYIIKNTKIMHESVKKTLIYSSTMKEITLLLGSGLLTAVGVYADKLILFPLLGGTAVTIYYVSTILGKTIALAIGPITSVLLSYLAHMKQFSKNNFKLLLVVSILIGSLGYILVVFISKPVLMIIYPQYANEAIKYIYITTAAIVLSIIANVINPILLRFMKAKWQVLINGVFIFIYISLSIVMLKLYGLYGFCIGILIANAVKLLLMIMIYYINNYNSKVNKTCEEY